MDTATPTNNEGKPIVRICAYCEKINQPNMARYATGIDPQIKKDMAVVHEQVQANTNKFSFSHGICIPHMIQEYSFMGVDSNKIEQTAAEMKNRGNAIPCLIQNAPLRHAYMRGLFTVEQMKQAQQQMQQSSQKSADQPAPLTERLKKLAGIKA